jgi:predicted Fe-Mo cluster-binding NifX family protein
MERIAIPIWDGRVSPVLDTAERLWVCEVGSHSQGTASMVGVRHSDIRQRAMFIRDLGINTLLCGALSRHLHNLLVSAGVAVRPWLTGRIEDVVAAYAEGRLAGDDFLLPGCRRRRQRGRSMGNAGGQGRRRRNKESL